MKLMHTLSLVALVALAACKHGPPEFFGAAQELPAPFDADELRAGLPVGTTVIFRSSLPGEEIALNVWEVVRADEQGFTIRAHLVDEEMNAIGPVSESEGTWENMEAGSRPPRGSEALAPAEQLMALGSLRVLSYVTPHKKIDDAFIIITYSEDHPGLPVKAESTLKGEILFTMEAIEWTVGP